METLDEWQSAHSSDIIVRYDTDEPRQVVAATLGQCLRPDALPCRLIAALEAALDRLLDA